MAFKDRVMKCIVEMGEEENIKQMSAGIAIRAAKDFDKIINNAKKDLSENMLKYTDELKELTSKERLKELIKEVIEEYEYKTKTMA